MLLELFKKKSLAEYIQDHRQDPDFLKKVGKIIKKEKHTTAGFNHEVMVNDAVRNKDIDLLEVFFEHTKKAHLHKQTPVLCEMLEKKDNFSSEDLNLFETVYKNVSTSNSSAEWLLSMALKTANLSVTEYLLRDEKINIATVDFNFRVENSVHSVLLKAAESNDIQFFNDVFSFVEKEFGEINKEELTVDLASWHGNSVVGHFLKEENLDKSKILLEAITDDNILALRYLQDYIDMDSIVDSCGRTPLHVAVNLNREGSIEWLCGNTNIDPTVEDKYSSSAADIVRTTVSSDKVIASVLRKSLKDNPEKPEWEKVDDYTVSCAVVNKDKLTKFSAEFNMASDKVKLRVTNLVNNKEVFSLKGSFHDATPLVNVDEAKEQAEKFGMQVR